EIFDAFTKIAEIKGNCLITDESNVLWEEPVRSSLQSCIRAISKDVTNRVRSENPGQLRYIARNDLQSSVAIRVISVLCRLLARVQGFRHGGAILLAPKKGWQLLNIKHRISYDRLPRALSHVVAYDLMKNLYWRRIHTE